MSISSIIAIIWIISGLSAAFTLTYLEVRDGYAISRKVAVLMFFFGVALAPLLVAVLCDDLKLFDNWHKWWSQPLFKGKSE